MLSILQKTKNIAQDLTPKFAICEVSSSGGLASATVWDHCHEIDSKYPTSGEELASN